VCAKIFTQQHNARHTTRGLAICDGKGTVADVKTPRSNEPQSGGEIADLAGSGNLELAVFTPSGVVRYPLPAEGQISIGRSEENDIRIEDSSVSRRHAVLHIGPPLRIEDVGSANGTRLRRERTTADTAKLLDMRIQMGSAVEVALGEPINVGATLIVVRKRARAPANAPGSLPFVVHDEAMKKLYELAQRVATGPISVLILGETGVGKEVLAEVIHKSSPRGAGPFLRLNCAALSESLLESELFGHEKGAFTHAVKAKPGLLETAEKGTVFLDEVGELPMNIQVKLLRVLEDRMVMRVGGLTPRPIDVRFVAATNRDLAIEVENGRFRQDLFFRLNGISLRIPPLRERPSEIVPLAAMFAARAAASVGKEPPALDPTANSALEAHRWPGNVRELRNVIERAVVLCPDGLILPEHLLLETGAPKKKASGEHPGVSSSLDIPLILGDFDAPVTGRTPLPGTLRSEIDWLERRRMLDALEKCAGNQTQAAALLGMPRRTFVARLTAYGIPRPRKKG